MSLNESDTRAKRIDPALHARGWTEDLIRREETAGAIEDGYLAACEIHRFDLFHDNKTVNERESGVTRNDLEGKHLVDAVTGTAVGADVAKEVYGASRSHFIATTVDLLTTGVDVPAVRNIVFFKYVRSPIAFYQMIGRGTRIHIPSDKLMFRVYDYTDATRLFGQEFIAKLPKGKKRVGPPPPPPEPTILVEGFEVRVTGAGRYIVTQVDGAAMPVTVEEYKERLTAKLLEDVPTLDLFRDHWIDPPERQEMLKKLPDAGRSALLVRQLEDMAEFDLYDVLAELGYGMAPRTRTERAEAFAYKNGGWVCSRCPKWSALEAFRR